MIFTKALHFVLVKGTVISRSKIGSPDVPPRETSPAAQSEEKRTFSQAIEYGVKMKIYIEQTHFIY